MTSTTPPYALFGALLNPSTPDETKAQALELLRQADLSKLSPSFKAKLVHALQELKA